MKFALLLVFALGVSAGDVPNMRELTVYGLQENNVLPYYLNTYYGLRTDLPFSVNPVITTYMPLTFGPFINKQLPQFFKSILNIQDIYQKPVVMMVKTPTKGEFDVFLLEQGLSTLTDNNEIPEVRHIFENIQTNTEKSAVLFHPYQIYDPTTYGLFEEFKLRNFQVLPEMKVTTFVRGLNAGVPVLLLQDKEDLHLFDSVHLMRLGNLEITENDIITHC